MFTLNRSIGIEEQVSFMKEINIKEYENLRERGTMLVGRIIPYDSKPTCDLFHS